MVGKLLLFLSEYSCISLQVFFWMLFAEDVDVLLPSAEDLRMRLDTGEAGLSGGLLHLSGPHAHVHAIEVVGQLHQLFPDCTGLHSAASFHIASAVRMFIQPSATSSAIIKVKPRENVNAPTSECSPWDISGISSSTTT